MTDDSLSSTMYRSLCQIIRGKVLRIEKKKTYKIVIAESWKVKKFFKKAGLTVMAFCYY